MSSSSEESESELDELESELELDDEELDEEDDELLAFPWAFRFSFNFRAISSSRFFFISFFISFVRESLYFLILSFFFLNRSGFGNQKVKID